MSSIPLPVAGLTVDPATIEAAGWTLVHFLWQGAILAAALALANAILARSRPQMRYAAGCVVLAVMIVAPIATFLLLRSADSPAGARATTSSSRLAHTDRTSPSPGAPAVATPTSRALAGFAKPANLRWPAVRMLRERVDSARLLPWFVGIWITGVALLSLRLVGGWWLVRRLVRSPHNAPIESCQEMWVRLIDRMGVTRPVRLVRSSLVQVPTAIGWLRPVVLLPATTLTGLPPSQIEAILAHELAHIRRHDYAINLLQSVVETLLFYHPAVWWVSKRVRDERELCCDDLAVRALGDPILYARALCELEQLRAPDAQLVLAANGGSLVSRIARLLGMGPQRPSFDASRGLAWALVAALVMVGGTAGGAVRVDSRASSAVAQVSDRVSRAVATAAEAIRVEAAASITAATPSLVAMATTTAIELAVRTATAVAAPVAAVTAQQVASELACETEPVDDETEAAYVSIAGDLEDVDDAFEGSAVVVDAEPREYTPQEWERLSHAGVGRSYVSALARAGYPDLSVTELEKLAQNGVTSEYAGRLHRMLDEPTVHDLVKLAQNGVMSAYVRAMRKELGDAVDVDGLVKLSSNGVSSRYVAGMRKLDLGDLTVDDIVRLASNGVTLDWFSSLRWMGYEDVSVDRAIQLRNAGVTSAYAASLRIHGRGQLSFDELKRLRDQGVEAEFAAAMMGLVRKDLSVEDLVRLRQNGVSVSYVASLKALGYSELTAEELVRLRQNGVQPEFIALMAGAGYDDLGAEDLVRLSQNGVNADFALQARDAGFEDLDVAELIRLKQRGLPKTRALP